VKIKTAELTGAALDWAVAKIEHPDLLWGSGIGIHHASHQIVIPHLPEPQCYWSPSTNWAQGGPIIERTINKLFRNVGGTWTAIIKRRDPYYSPTYDADIGMDTLISCAGPTPLIAAMRCYVASVLGDTVDIPEELT
jgi:hypothetical protein